MKKTFLRWITVLALLALLAVPQAYAQSAAAASVPHIDSIGARMDEFLQSHQDNHAAIAVAVFHGDADLYTRHFGYIDAAGTVPLDENCVLEWGSTSKLTVWLAAMQLWEQGKLDLDADIRTYLPDVFLSNLTFDKPISMLHLMNHSAGFQETTFVLEAASEEDIIPLGEYLAAYQPQQVFEPGTVVAYSNWGAALAGYIVECISDMPFSQYVQQHIFAPLGMNHSAIAADLSDNAYVQNKRKEFVSYLPDGTLSTENNKVFILPYPAGMCTSTLSDFAMFGKALLTRDSRLLTEKGFEQLFSPSMYYTGTDIPRAYHGFLVDYDFSVPVIGHDGNTMGGSSRLLLDLENNVGMVVLSNQLGGSLYRTGMAELLFGKSEHHIAIDGYYVPARGVFAGKLKMLYNLFLIRHCHITDQMVEGLYINILPDRFEISTTDYLVPAENYWVRDGLAVAWFVLSAAILLISLVRVILLVINTRKKRGADPLNRVSAVYGLLLVLSLLAIIPAVPAIAAGIYAVILGVGGVAVAIYLVICGKKLPNNWLSKLSYWQTWSLLLCLAVTIANYLVWELAAF